MNRDQGVELAIVLLSCFVYAAYHIQYFVLRPWWRQRSSRKSRHAAIFFASRYCRAALKTRQQTEMSALQHSWEALHMCMLCSDARLVWTFLATQNSTDAGVPAVQTLRNRSE